MVEMLLMRESTLSNNKAFTFVEVVVAAAIIAILLIVGAVILSASLTNVLNEGVDTQLLYEAQDAMEGLISNTINTDSTAYPSLILEGSTQVMTINSGGTSVAGVSGTYYIIREAATNNILLTSFVPDEE